MNIYSIIGLLSYFLVILGAINWGLVGIFNFDAVARLFGAGSLGAKIVYILIGLAAIVMLLV